jgi:aryl-alcohol dehydrogenase-like predicted oxidoreductase
MLALTLPAGGKLTTPLGFGCAYLVGGMEMRASRRLVDAAFDAGLRHFDTAPAYGLGMAEDVLGATLKGRRHNVTLTTKAGIGRPSVSPWMLTARAVARPLYSLIPAQARRRIGTATANSPRSQFAADSIAQSLTESLRRLNTDHVDAFLLHEARLSDISDELLNLLQQVKRKGKVCAIGVASARSAVAEIAHAYGGEFDIFQYSWSVLEPKAAPLTADIVITHRAMRRALLPLQRWFSSDPKALHRLSDIAGLDLAADNVLADTLLAAALADNPKGIVLAASRQEARVLRFGAVMKDERLREAGARLASALAREENRPAPEE